MNATNAFIGHDLVHPSILSACAFVVITTLTIFFLGKRAQSTKDKNDDKKQKYLPPLTSRSQGEIVQNLFSPNAPMFFLQMIREAGDPPAIRLPLSFPGAPLLCILNDHRLVRKVLDDPLSTKWALAYHFFNMVVGGENLLSSEGSRSKHSRKATAMAFSPDNVKRMVEVISVVVDEWMTQVLEPKYIASGEPFDVSDEMTQITCDVILKVAFDYKLTDKECKDVTRNIKIAYTEFSQRTQLNPFRKFWLTGWLFAQVREARQATRELCHMGKRILVAHRAKEHPNENIILDMIDKNPDYRNDDDRVRDVLTYLIGGFDTTAYSLAWAVLELARHPHEQIKLRQALRACASEEEKRNHPVLKHVIREAMRLRTVSALGSLRIAATDISVPGSSMTIPAKTICFMPFYGIHRNASCYPNPDVFDPSRWENPSEDMLQCFLPFGCGRRNCPGQALANSEMYVILARLMEKYEFAVVEEGRTEYNVVLRSVGTLLKATRAE